MMSSKYVIIGNSHAAVGCIEGIRSADAAGTITVISKEKRPAYGRPLISYYLQGKTTPEKMRYRSADYYEKNGVKVIYGEAAAVEPRTKTVLLKDGSMISYDKLMYAAGSVPFLPPMPGLDGTKHFSFMTMDDAEALEAAISRESRVLIIGAGLIGLKCAEGLYGRVASITVADLAGRILPSVYDEKASGIMMAHLESKGIRFRLGVSVAAFENGAAVFTDGVREDFDIIVTAVGVRPNIGILKEAGAECGRGVLTDAKSRTSLPGIYAAGDCTQYDDISSGQNRIMAILPNAYEQGRIGGINMAGGEASFDNAFPINSLGLFGLHTVTAGSYDGDSVEFDENGYKKLFFRDDRLIGFIIMGDVTGSGIYSALIRNRTPLSSIDFELTAHKPQLLGFDKAARKEMLGGAHFEN
ncbi:MAG: FAD-dependent oxidoreductase [Firmicutes bacterium]|nr:FAD-dependent oxidoreductase [Bacillota bacterium]